MTFVVTGPVATSVLFLQAAEDSGGIPWWLWFVLISVLLLLLLIGFARQPEPGPPLPKPDERVAPSAAAVVAEAASEEAAIEAPTGEEKTVDKEPAEKTVAVTSESNESAGEVSEAEAAPIDDLKRIEGIGPKISAVLNDSGITTYAGLAAAEPEQLQQILDAAGIRLAHPATWPEQAALAAAGKWDDLEKLQDSMKGGRKKQTQP